MCDDPMELLSLHTHSIIHNPLDVNMGHSDQVLLVSATCAGELVHILATEQSESAKRPPLISRSADDELPLVRLLRLPNREEGLPARWPWQLR